MAKAGKVTKVQAVVRDMGKGKLAARGPGPGMMKGGKRVMRKLMRKRGS